MALALPKARSRASPAACSSRSPSAPAGGTLGRGPRGFQVAARFDRPLLCSNRRQLPAGKVEQIHHDVDDQGRQNHGERPDEPPDAGQAGWPGTHDVHRPSDADSRERGEDRYPHQEAFVWPDYLI